MSVYLRNGVIALIANIVVFLIGWGCIVPDQLLDNTHLFGLIGDVEVIKGNTSTVFCVCSVMSTLIMVVSLVEAIIEDYQPRFCPTRNERPRKPQKFEAAGMRIADPSPAKEDPKISGMKISDPTPQKVVDEDKDPKTPTMD